VIKISFFPHKNKYLSVLARYECSKSVEELLETDMENFFTACTLKWNDLHVEESEKKDLFPIMWRVFTPKSHRKIMAFVFEFFLLDKPRLELVEELEVRTFHGKIIKCLVLFSIQRYPEPYQFWPQSYTAVIRPLSKSE
jgi:hypothetical protein